MLFHHAAVADGPPGFSDILSLYFQGLSSPKAAINCS